MKNKERNTGPLFLYNPATQTNRSLVKSVENKRIRGPTSTKFQNQKYQFLILISHDRVRKIPASRRDIFEAVTNVSLKNLYDERNHLKNDTLPRKISRAFFQFSMLDNKKFLGEKFNLDDLTKKLFILDYYIFIRK